MKNSQGPKPSPEQAANAAPRLRSYWKEAQGLESLGIGPHGPDLTLGWMLGLAGLILLCVIGVVSWLAVQRSEEAMAQLLAEKGSSLIMAFKSALRTGMRGDSGIKLQVLLEEMAKSQDLEFVAVTMPDGMIIAHSQRIRLGEILRLDGEELDEERMGELAPGEEADWRIAEIDGKRIFLVYKHFLLDPKSRDTSLPLPTIFLGLDLSPFEITSSQNRSYLTMLGLVTLFAVLLCLLAVGYADRARESRRREARAEDEVRRMAEDVRRSEKMAAIGALAAGVAHEIRNPLSSIKGYATYFGQRFPKGSEEEQAATVMVGQVQRLNQVISDLLGLARPSDVRLAPASIENVARQILRLIRADAAKRGVSIDLRVACEIPYVLLDIDRFGQALLNLCLNALEAMPAGGKLTLALASARKRVCLIVKDNGSGIAPELLGKIFDPYFTTKGSGTGLGLALVDKIIRAHGGEIQVHSRLCKKSKSGQNGLPTDEDMSQRQEARGLTIFRIWLPLAQNAQAGNSGEKEDKNG